MVIILQIADHRGFISEALLRLHHFFSASVCGVSAINESVIGRSHNFHSVLLCDYSIDLLVCGDLEIESVAARDGPRDASNIVDGKRQNYFINGTSFGPLHVQWLVIFFFPCS